MFGRPSNVIRKTRNMTNLAKLAGVALVLLLFSIPAFAQILYGSLTGTISARQALIGNDPQR